jgi:CheY-like chemotaxis protein
MSNAPVLLVEDDRYGWEVVVHMLNYHNIAVDVVNSAEDALNQLASNQYELAIFDLALPKMDGWQLLRAVQSDPQTADLPCVAITAFHDATVAREALSAGFVAYFPKPLQTTFPNQLMEVLNGN